MGRINVASEDTLQGVKIDVENISLDVENINTNINGVKKEIRYVPSDEYNVTLLDEEKSFPYNEYYANKITSFVAEYTGEINVSVTFKCSSTTNYVYIGAFLQSSVYLTNFLYVNLKGQYMLLAKSTEYVTRTAKLYVRKGDTIYFHIGTETEGDTCYCNSIKLGYTTKEVEYIEKTGIVKSIAKGNIISSSYQIINIPFTDIPPDVGKVVFFINGCYSVGGEKYCGAYIDIFTRIPSKKIIYVKLNTTTSTDRVDWIAIEYY